MEDVAPWTRRWPIAGLLLALAAGFVFRLIWAEDIEYKVDEAWTFTRTQAAGVTEPWPRVGMPMSVGRANPGLSVWAFIVPARLFGVTDPPSLARLCQLSNVVALLLLVLFAWRVVAPEQREPWLWAAALGALNPIAVLFHRKIWPPSLAPALTVLLVACWWQRRRPGGAFCAGLFGVLVGQLHAMGFFLTGGIVVWTLLFDRREVRWLSWLLGSFAGALFLLPLLVEQTAHQGRSAPPFFAFHGWQYWWHWGAEPLGISLRFTLGEEFTDFLRYPLLGGNPTWLMGVCHVVLVGLSLVLLFRAVRGLWLRSQASRSWQPHSPSETAFLANAGCWGSGLLFLLACLRFQRHYLIVFFPLPFLSLSLLALRAGNPRTGRALLLALCLTQAAVTAGFLCYVHGCDHWIPGDYGRPYVSQVRHGTVLSIP